AELLQLRDFELPFGDLSTDVEQLPARRREVHVDRIELLDASQQRRLRGADERTLGDLRAPGAPRDRSGDGRELEIELGTLELGPRLGRAGLGGSEARDGRVVFLLADGAVGDEILVALDLLLRVCDLRLGSRDRRPRGIDGRAHLARIDEEELLTFRDVRALLGTG